MVGKAKSVAQQFILSNDETTALSRRAVQAIVHKMRDNNDPPIKQDSVKGFASKLAANEWLLDNPAKTAAGVHFAVTSPTAIDFVLQANTTTKAFRATFDDPMELVAMPLQVAAQREIVRCGFCVCAVQSDRVQFEVA